MDIMQADKLIQIFETSLSHAQGNYQMIVLQELALGDASKEELVKALMDANKGKTQSFFNSHCVFRVLKNKKLIKENKSKEFSLNLTKATIKSRQMVLDSAKKALKIYEVSH